MRKQIQHYPNTEYHSHSPVGNSPLELIVQLPGSVNS